MAIKNIRVKYKRPLWYQIKKLLSPAVGGQKSPALHHKSGRAPLEINNHAAQLGWPYQGQNAGLERNPDAMNT